MHFMAREAKCEAWAGPRESSSRFCWPKVVKAETAEVANMTMKSWMVFFICIPGLLYLHIEADARGSPLVPAAPQDPWISPRLFSRQSVFSAVSPGRHTRITRVHWPLPDTLHSRQPPELLPGCRSSQCLFQR